MAVTSALPALTLLVDGKPVPGRGRPMTVLDKCTGQPIASGAKADAAQVAQVLDVAQAAFRTGAPGPHARGEILGRAARLLGDRAAQVADVIQAESGFTASDAKGEVTRCIQTLRLSAEVACGLRGEVVPIAGAPNQCDRIAFTLRVPLGIVLAITPFNAPLNNVCHKIAPAFAARNAVVVKPASATPLTTLALAGVLLDAAMPPGFLSVLLGGAEITHATIADDRVRFIAFTGSTLVGRAIQSAAGLRRTQMELGSIAFTILAEDAPLARAVPKIVGASYRKAGQVCTSVQIALAHAARMAETA